MTTLALWATAVLSAGFLSAGVIALRLDSRRRYHGRHRAMW